MLLDWMSTGHVGAIDPIVAAAMAHYQFETLHPFRDGNGRIGRYLIVLHLVGQGTISEPTLTVSPWFEERRGEYYDHLLAVSTRGDWAGFVGFFADGLAMAANLTLRQLVHLSQVREELHGVVRKSQLRAETALRLVDLAVASPTFTIRQVHEKLGVSKPRAATLVNQLEALGVLSRRDIRESGYGKLFYAPDVINVLLDWAAQ